MTLLRREILGSPRPVTLIPMAPLTNIALLLRTHPEVTANIERIVFMGGAVEVGNATPVAEFNVWHDPEAAAVLLTAGVPITMYGLDVFRRVVVPGVDVQRLRASAEPGARLAGELLAHRDPAATGDPTPSGGLGDAGAVCSVADPAGLTTSLLPVEVSSRRARPAARRSSTADRAPASPRSTTAPVRNRWWTWRWTSTWTGTWSCISGRWRASTGRRRAVGGRADPVNDVRPGTAREERYRGGRTSGPVQALFRT